MTYDLIILGGGPAGYNAAERAAHGGMQVLLLEERALGGVCLNEGCIPTKTLLNSAKIYDSALHGADYGVQVTGASIDRESSGPQGQGGEGPGVRRRCKNARRKGHCRGGLRLHYRQGTGGIPGSLRGGGASGEKAADLHGKRGGSASH